MPTRFRLILTAPLLGVLSPSPGAQSGTPSRENSISTGALVAVGPHGKVSVPLSLDKAEWAVTPSLGVMVVSIDNFWLGQQEQAELLQVPGGRRDDR